MAWGCSHLCVIISSHADDPLLLPPSDSLRLWLTTEPTDSFPVVILQVCGCVGGEGEARRRSSGGWRGERP